MSDTSPRLPYHSLTLGLAVLGVRLQGRAEYTLAGPSLAPVLQLCGLSALPSPSGLCHLALLDVLLSNKVISHIRIQCLWLD